MVIIKTINLIIGLVFFACYSYQFFFISIPFIKKPKPHKEIKPHKYAILIPACNEELVIKQLLNSISNQTYDSKLVTVFVIADNCTDRTAQIAEEEGAIVYKRTNKNLIGKGYALECLLQNIAKNYPSDAFDGYFVFDADNILGEKYLEEMNKTFSDGYEIVTSYRNSKNYGDNWISAGYALWFLRESKYLNYPRFLLKTSCAVSGTGFMFSREIIEKSGGWNYFLLTEDIEFTVHNVVGGEKIGFSPKAIFYDEQPTKFSQSWNQRMRWARGYLQVYRKYGRKMIKGTFKGSFSCFDMSMTIMPAIVLTVFDLFVNLIGVVLALSLKYPVLIAFQPIADVLISIYLTLFILGFVTTVTEWKNIHTSIFKKIFFALTFPLFMLTYIPISFIALFKKTKWSHIEHNKALTLEEIKCQDNK
ncbi:MAG: glycosyltransferase family 2 protein [Bacilli bacterium]|nr:glycosyltransferase family 2 protein [Bacilli bacterium]